jgi:anti-sigma-K factor RskA
MTRDHSRIEELMAAEALGGLDDDDRAALARERAVHGDCEECARLEASFAETAGRLGFALDPEPVGDEMADRILGAPGTSAPGTRPVTRRSAPRRGLVAVAAAVALVVAVVLVRDATRPRELAATFSGSAPAHLEMRFTPGDPGARLRGSGFAPIPSGHTYELWMIRGGTPIRATCFIPHAGRIDLALATPVQGSDVMAVTVESSSCPSAPTTTPILTADLSTVS